MIYGLILMGCCLGAKKDATEYDKRNGKNSQLQGSREKVKKCLNNWLGHNPGPAQITLKDLTNPVNELNPNRLIKSILLDYCVYISELFGVGNIERRSLHGIKKLQKGKNKNRNAKKNGDDQQ